jgi:endonuclease/exonuclease/phosphatase family metal-dependent hydrolase
MYPSIFIRKGKFEYLTSGDLWLSETPEVAGSRSFDSTFPRLMTWARLQLKNSEQTFLVVNTHLDHIKSETRQGQIRVLIQEIKRIQSPNTPLLILGDFNESPDGEVRKILIQEFRSLKDAWREHHQTEETSHHSFSGEVQNGARIDWVLVDQRLTVESCLMDKSTRGGAYPSDHFPIICQIRL